MRPAGVRRRRRRGGAGARGLRRSRSAGRRRRSSRRGSRPSPAEDNDDVFGAAARACVGKLRDQARGLAAARAADVAAAAAAVGACARALASMRGDARAAAAEARAAVRRRVGEATAALGAASGFGETRAAAGRSARSPWPTSALCCFNLTIPRSLGTAWAPAAVEAAGPVAAAPAETDSPLQERIRTSSRRATCTCASMTHDAPPRHRRDD